MHRRTIGIAADIGCEPGWERPLKLINQRHELIAVRLWHSSELELPDVGPIIMEDSETGEQLYVDTHDPKLRARFRQAAHRREAALGEAFKHASVDALSLGTNDDLVRAIVRFARLRQQRRR